jgi:hypothetical protein
MVSLKKWIVIHHNQSWIQIPNSNDQRLESILGLTIVKIVQAKQNLRGSCCLLQKITK